MTPLEITILAAVFGVIAVVYASVGHGGASGYLAAMALAGFVPAAVMKPTALSLNILVAGLATAQFARVGGFPWRLLWPLVVTSIPCAFIGGALELDPTLYKRGLGVVLLVAAVRLMIRARNGQRPPRSCPWPLGLGLGAAIGFVSGLIGVGGGIFLSPLLLLAGWADAKRTAIVSAAFILANSISGLLGHLVVVQQLPAAVPVWGIAVAVGGFVGSALGSRRFGTLVFRRALAVVLIIAAAKMFLATPHTPEAPAPLPPPQTP